MFVRICTENGLKLAEEDNFSLKRWDECVNRKTDNAKIAGSGSKVGKDGSQEFEIVEKPKVRSSEDEEEEKDKV